MPALDRLDPEQQALCLGARTRIDPDAVERLAWLQDQGVDWAIVWELGHRHEVVPLLADSLPRALGEALPADGRARATRRRHVTLRANAHLADALFRVLDAFDAAAVPVIPVKGLVLADQLYGSLAARPAADLDVLVRTVDLETARTCLRELGFRQRSEPGFFALQHDFHDPAWAYGAGPDQVRLGLHRALWAPGRFGLSVEELWSRAGPARLLDRNVLSLAEEDMLLHLAIHRTRSALRLRWVCDVAELVRVHGPGLDWDEVVRRADRAGARSAMWMILDLAATLLGAAVPAAVRSELRPGSAKRAVLEQTCGAAAMFRPAGGGDLSQQPHLALRAFEQDGAARILRGLASSIARPVRRFLHETGLRPVRPAV